MKFIRIGLFLWSVLALNAWSQGRITFVNNLPTLKAPIYGPELDFINYGGDWADAKTGNSPTGIPAGTQTYGGALLESFSVSFWAAPGAVNDGHLLVPASSTAILGTGSLAGYFPATSVLFPGLPATGIATLQVRVTDPSGTWMFAGDQFGNYAAVSALFTVNLSSLGSTATSLRSFSVGWIDSTTFAPYVPEPGAGSLLVLGAVALISHRWFRKRTLKLQTMLSAAMAGCLVATTLCATDQPGLLKSEFIYETAPFPSCHASTIAETKDGLIAAWFGGTDEKEPDVGIWVSRYEGGHWTAPVEAANGVESPTKRYPTWNPVLFQPKTGPLMLFYKVGPDPRTWWGMLMTSADAGKTWSKPRRLPDGIVGPIKNKPVQLANGDILSPTSSEDAGWRVHFERSSDLGQTWTATPPVNDGKKIGAIQPSILFHPDGKLQALGRTRQGKIFETWSTDAGRTWSEMTLTDLPNPNAGTDAVTLKDSRHLLIYNPVTKGRSPLALAASPDGKTWSAALVLENEPGKEFSYPAIIQTRDGLVHVTYTWKRERIKHAVIDPAKLQLEPLTDGNWPK